MQVEFYFFSSAQETLGSRIKFLLVEPERIVHGIVGKYLG